MNISVQYSEHFLLPSTLYVSDSPCRIITILGSCVSVCIWDKTLRIGGMNHYMLPLWNGEGLASPKYGNIAIPKLIDEMLKHGSRKKDMVIKIFGGGNVINTVSSEISIGERNVNIAKEILSEQSLFIAASSVNGQYGRKILFDTYTGDVFQKYLQKTIDLQSVQSLESSL
ncbi:MAG: chemotaxis protein CheD [Bacteroidales bacterium]